MKTFAISKISPPFDNYVTKTMLSDAELREEHEYSPIGQMMAELWTFLGLDVGEITKKE